MIQQNSNSMMVVAKMCDLIRPSRATFIYFPDMKILHLPHNTINMLSVTGAYSIPTIIITALIGPLSFPLTL